MLAIGTRSSFSRRNGASLFQLNSALSITTNAALDFHNLIWDSFEKRFLKHKQQCYSPARQESLSAPTEATSRALEQSKRLRNSYEDLFKHFRARASFRAMKRGDGILSECFSLNVCHKKDKKHGFVPYANEDLALIEVRKARKAREDMHHKFWTAHQSRKDIAAQRPFNDEKTSLYSKTNREHKISFYAVHPDKHRNRAPLPSKLEDIYLDFFGFNSNSFDLPIRRQAIAITEATPPFKIIDVNKAWIDLCGYSRKQAIGSTLKILQGPETNLHAASKLVSTLLAKAVPGDNKNEECETVLTNYRSDGKKFRNHIRVGLLKDDVGKVINFVGVFKRLDDDDELIV